MRAVAVWVLGALLAAAPCVLTRVALINERPLDDASRRLWARVGHPLVLQPPGGLSNCEPLPIEALPKLVLVDLVLVDLVLVDLVLVDLVPVDLVPVDLVPVDLVHPASRAPALRKDHQHPPCAAAPTATTLGWHGDQNARQDA